MTVVLDARSITVRFGGVLACDAIDIQVGAGEIVGLTGPNGSGKSTFLNAVSGLVPARGTLKISGREMPLGNATDVARHRVARAFQAAQTWTSLSCLENVLLGSADRHGHGLVGSLLRRSAMRSREHHRWERALAILSQAGLAPHARRSAAELTYGQRRMLELARAMAAEPELMLLDEPAAGLNAVETNFLADLLADLAHAGTSVLVIDHKIDFLDRIADRMVVLSLGRVIADASPIDVWNDQTVIDAYLGTSRHQRREDT